MTKIALAAAAVLAMSGIALAGSDHYGTINSNHSVFVDETFTASIHRPATSKHMVVDPRPPMNPGQNSTRESGATDLDNIFNAKSDGPWFAA